MENNEKYIASQSYSSQNVLIDDVYELFYEQVEKKNHLSKKWEDENIAKR